MTEQEKIIQDLREEVRKLRLEIEALKDANDRLFSQLISENIEGGRMTNLEKAIDEAALFLEDECSKALDCESCPVGTLCDLKHEVSGEHIQGIHWWMQEVSKEWQARR